MTIREKLLSILSRIIRGIDSKLPDNWKYYTETFAGLILLLASFGSLILAPRSYVSGLAFLLTALYIVPDIRFRVLFRLNVRPPRYSVPVVLLLGLMVAGLFSPQTAGGLLGPTFDSDAEIDVEERQPVKAVSGIAEVRNNGAQDRNYTVGIAKDGELVESKTSLIGSKDSEKFNITVEVQDEGEHSVRFYSSKSNVLTESNNSGFSLEESVTLPNYLNEENIKSSVQQYSPIPQKDLSIIQNVEVNATGDGRKISLRNKAENTYGIFDLMKTATANSFHTSKQIFQDFQDISHVSVSTTADYTYRNGTVQERVILETDLSEEDAENINWQTKTDQIRDDYEYWLNTTTSYTIEENLCEGLSKEINCSR